jgi:hypothetical protein
MKLLLVVFFFSVNALACPQISGTYTCETEDGPEILEISQTNSSGIETFNIDGTDFVADGVTKKYADTEFNGTITATCSLNKLDITTFGDIYESGTKTSYVAVKESYYASKDGLVYAINGNFEHQGQVYPINEKVNCSKN